MRIAIIALGSRGDVQPYVALGVGLKAAGHAVRLVTHENFAPLAAAHGLEARPVRGDVQAVAESEEMRALLAKGNFLAITRRTAQEARQVMHHWAEDGLGACRGVELIVAGVGGLFIGLALAEKLDVPFMQAYLVPFTPTSEFPGVLLPVALPRLGGGFNRLSHRLVRQVMWQGSRAADNVARRQVFDLPPAPLVGPFGSERLRRLPVLYGFSSAVVPRPADWDTNTHVTGYWFLDPAADWTPPPALAAFLDDGPPPVYVGFGSMASREPEATADLVLSALAATGQRAVMLSGWAGLQADRLPPSVMMVESVPHAWLFPRVAAVVHHGGAGTTAAGLRAGVPSILIPFFGDQGFWAERVRALGVGPEPIPRPKLTAERLATAIQQSVADEALRRRAAELGATIRAEDGVGRAVTIFHALSESV
jgi:UDP:flavonoid glycosyltransferase YjiC (YdhE family)